MIKFTFNEYIKNPMGRKNAVFSQREMFRSLYRQKLDGILARELGKIEYKLFKDKNRYLIYFKIPSEVVPKFYYDTIIEFYTDDNSVKYDNTLDNYDVRFYSNDPSFVYTFAHAFNEHGLVIPDLISKLPKIAIKKAAVEKNPTNQIGYVKSIFFSYLLMRQYKLFDKDKFELYAEKYDKNKLLKQVENAEDKISKRQEEGSRLKKAIKYINKDNKPSSTNSSHKLSNSNSFSVKHTPTISNTRSINNAKKSNTIKKTKRI